MKLVPENYEFFVQLFWNFLYRFEDWREIFKANFPEYYADVESVLENPNCTCRFKLEENAVANQEKIIKLINDFVVDKNIEEFDIDQFTKSNQSVVYHGMIETVKISEWKEYTDQLREKNAVFREFSIAKNNDGTVDVFFL